MPPETTRYYRLNGTGHLAYAEWFDATSDEDATAQVEAKYPHQRSEIWQGTRLVRRLTPKRFNEDDHELQSAVGKRLSALARTMRRSQEPPA